MNHIALALLLAVASCSFKNKELVNQTPEGHENLYALPDAKNLEVPKNLKRIVIASTNDLEGYYGGATYSFSDKHSKETQTITIGGADVMSSYFQVLKDAYKNVLFFDSGDIFPDDSKNLSSVPKFYEDLGFDGVTVGLRDFGLKLPAKKERSSEVIKEFAAESKVPLFMSNLFDLRTGRSVDWKGLKPYHIFERDGVKVGVLGLVPNDVVSLTTTNNRVGLYVEDMLESTLRHARLMRSLGAQIIVVLTHQGMTCGQKIVEETKLPLNKVNFEPTKEKICDTSDVLGSYLERLPPQLVDVVIGGRTHQKMANFINGTLVMSGFEHGKSFNFAEFFVDQKSGKILPEKTVVHQPVMFCREFFKDTRDCYFEDASVDHKNRIPATFLGEEIKPNESLKKKYQPFFEAQTANYSHEVDLGVALKHFGADLAYFPKTSMTTQLLVIELGGDKVIDLLVEDFHQSERDHWKPEPFSVSDDTLTLKLSGEKIDPKKTYRVLTDLESMQERKQFHRLFRDHSLVSFAKSSWAELSLEDSIETQMAALQRQ